MTKKLNTGTLCVQGGWQPKKGEARVLPIFQSTTFKYDTSEQMARLFDLEDSGYFYSRLQNPTVDAVGAKINALEGGVGCVMTSSGQAANFYAILNICQAGDHFVSATTIYGGTYNLFAVTLKKMGIEVTFVDADIDHAVAFAGESKVTGQILGDADVFLDVLGVDNAAVTECETVLFLVECSFGEGLDAFVGYSFLVEEFLNGIAADEMFFNDTRNLVYFNLGIESAFRINDHNRTECTKTEAAGFYDLDLICEVVRSKLRFELFDYLHGAGRSTAGTAANQYMRTNHKCLFLLKVRSGLHRWCIRKQERRP